MTEIAIFQADQQLKRLYFLTISSGMTGDVPDGFSRQPVDEIFQKQRNRQILENFAKLDFL